jgi:hypothetical protein
MQDSFLHRLPERIKELTGLHRTARLLQDVGRPDDELMHDHPEQLRRLPALNPERSVRCLEP